MIFDYNDGNRLQFNERNPCPNWPRSRHYKNEWNLNCVIDNRAMILSYPSPCAYCCLSLVFSSVSSSYGKGEGKRRILFILVLYCALLCALLCLYRWTLYIRSIHSPFLLFLALFGRVLTVTSQEPSLKLSEWRAGERTIVHFYRKWPLEKIKKLPEEHTGPLKWKILKFLKIYCTVQVPLSKPRIRGNHPQFESSVGFRIRRPKQYQYQISNIIPLDFSVCEIKAV